MLGFERSQTLGLSGLHLAEFFLGLTLSFLELALNFLERVETRCDAIDFLMQPVYDLGYEAEAHFKWIACHGVLYKDGIDRRVSER